MSCHGTSTTCILAHVKKACAKQQFQDGENNLEMFTDSNPYDQLQQLIAQCNENTRTIHKLIESHNKLDGIVMELTEQHSRMAQLLVQTRTDIQNLNTRLHEVEHANDSK